VENSEFELWKSQVFDKSPGRRITPVSSAQATVLAYVPRIVMKWNDPLIRIFRKTLHFENSLKIVVPWKISVKWGATKSTKRSSMCKLFLTCSVKSQNCQFWVFNLRWYKRTWYFNLRYLYFCTVCVNRTSFENYVFSKKIRRSKLKK